jgi:hypothetical protein
MSKIIAVLVWSLAAAAFAQADRDHDRDWGWGDRDHGPVAAPEIDPASAVGALTLLAGGLAVVRGRSRKK